MILSSPARGKIGAKRRRELPWIDGTVVDMSPRASVPLQVRPFCLDDLDAAAALLSERHRRHRAAQPALAARFEDVAHTRAELRELLDVEGASGAVAVRGDELVGYLVGVPRDGNTWGRATWIGAAGHASREAEVVRDLYAAAAQRWVDDGRIAHYALVPAFDRDVLEAWYRLGFGQQHAHAVRPVPATSAPPAGAIRPARADDVPRIAELDLELPHHQLGAPTFSAAAVPSLEETIAEWRDDLGRGELVAFVAEVGGRVVGSSTACDLAQSPSHAGLAAVDAAGLLAFAAVDPDARGRGLGRALGEAVLHWCAGQGYQQVVTDWRTTNLLSSRTWTALGFVPTYFRLHRLIGY